MEYKEQERVVGRKKDEVQNVVKILEEQNKKLKEKKSKYKKSLIDVDKRLKDMEFEKEMEIKAIKRKSEMTLGAKEVQIRVFCMMRYY